MAPWQGSLFLEVFIWFCSASLTHIQYFQIQPQIKFDKSQGCIVRFGEGEPKSNTNMRNEI